MNNLFNFLESQRNNFFKRRVEDLNLELDHIDEQIAELENRRALVVTQIKYSEARITS